MSVGEPFGASNHSSISLKIALNEKKTDAQVFIILSHSVLHLWFSAWAFFFLFRLTIINVIHSITRGIKQMYLFVIILVNYLDIFQCSEHPCTWEMFGVSGKTLWQCWAFWGQSADILRHSDISKADWSYTVQACSSVTNRSDLCCRCDSVAKNILETALLWKTCHTNSIPQTVNMRPGLNTIPSVLYKYQWIKNTSENDINVLFPSIKMFWWSATWDWY